MLQVKLFKLDGSESAEVEINNFYAQEGNNIIQNGVNIKDGMMLVTYSKPSAKGQYGYDKAQMISVVEGVLNTVIKERLSVEHELRYWTAELKNYKPAKKGTEDNKGVKLDAKVTEYKDEVETYDKQIATLRGVIKEIEAGEFTV